MNKRFRLQFEIINVSEDMNIDVKKTKVIWADDLLELSSKFAILLVTEQCLLHEVEMSKRDSTVVDDDIPF